MHRPNQVEIVNITCTAVLGTMDAELDTRCKGMCSRELLFNVWFKLLADIFIPRSPRSVIYRAHAKNWVPGISGLPDANSMLLLAPIRAYMHAHNIIKGDRIIKHHLIMQNLPSDLSIPSAMFQCFPSCHWTICPVLLMDKSSRHNTMNLIASADATCETL